MAFQAIDEPTNTTKFVEIITAIDNLLVIRGESADPNADVGAAQAGIFYFNTTTKQLWLCTTEGAAGAAVWEPIIFSVQAATTDTAGVVELATSSEVTAGDATDKAVTPASIKNVYPLQSYVDAADAVLASAISSASAIANANESDLASATNESTAGELIRRDGSGKAKIADATLSSEIVNKGQMDAADTALQDQIDAHDVVLDNATDAATANTVAKRDASGRLSVGVASASGHAVRKAELDALTTVVDGHTTSLNNAVSTPTASRIAKRDASGRCQFGAGVSDDDAVIMSQLNALNAEVDTNTADVATNAGDIAVLEDLADTLLGGKDLDTLALSTDAATPTTALVKLNVETGSLDDCKNLLTTNGVRILFVTNDDPSKPITLKHGANATDGFLENFGSSDIVLDTEGQIVIYALVEDTTNKYVQVGAIGFDSGGTSGGSSLFRAKNITETLRTLPTSGNIEGIYVMKNVNWVSTGALTATGPVEILMNGGSFQLNHILTATPVVPGGVGDVGRYSNGNRDGKGPGGGSGGIYNNGAGGAGGGSPGGAKGGNGNNYNNGSGDKSAAGLGYSPNVSLLGSGGGAGGNGGAESYIGGNGGKGGSYVLIEAYNCNLDINEDITVNGEDGQTTASNNYNGAGAGGGAGSIHIQGGGTTTFDLASGKKLQAKGGKGANAQSIQGAGGPGAGGYVYATMESATLIINGSIDVSAGAVGTHPSGASYYSSAGEAGDYFTDILVKPVSIR